MSRQKKNAVAQFQRALGARTGRTRLRLYVAGMAPRSLKAISDLQQLCERHHENAPEVEIIDIYQQPHLAVRAQIIAVPTLVKEHPQPVRKLLGSLGDLTLVSQKLGLSASKG